MVSGNIKLAKDINAIAAYVLKLICLLADSKLAQTLALAEDKR